MIILKSAKRGSKLLGFIWSEACHFCVSDGKCCCWTLYSNVSWTRFPLFRMSSFPVEKLNILKSGNPVQKSCNIKLIHVTCRRKCENVTPRTRQNVVFPDNDFHFTGCWVFLWRNPTLWKVAITFRKRCYIKLNHCIFMWNVRMSRLGPGKT